MMKLWRSGGGFGTDREGIFRVGFWMDDYDHAPTSHRVQALDSPWAWGAAAPLPGCAGGMNCYGLQIIVQYAGVVV